MDKSLLIKHHHTGLITLENKTGAITLDEEDRYKLAISLLPSFELEVVANKEVSK